jgi:GAF domain-containing protein
MSALPTSTGRASSTRSRISICATPAAYALGADGKVRQLEAMYPHLRAEEPAPGPTNTIATPVERLDLATVIKVSQTVASEMVPEKLIDTLMRMAIEQAGAERGLLIVEQRIAAEAVTSGDSVLVRLCDEPVTAVALPESVLHYVVRANESVILDDAAAQSEFATDPYIRQRQARSILCLPLINQGRLNGVLYLENNLTSRVFPPADHGAEAARLPGSDLAGK